MHFSTKKFLSTMLILCITFGIFNVPIKASTLAKNEFRAIWVGTVFGLNYPSKPTTNENLLKKDAIEILDNVKDMGFNAVIFQVRPASDAFYKSDIFPWSKFLTGTEGLAPSNNFDPLQFFVEQAHIRGIELHAWINPYRVTASKGDKPSSTNPATLNSNLTVTHTDGKIYWNPGEVEAREIILDGVQEIVDKYDVDGIHIDDYFYPESNFADSSTYKKYGKNFNDIDEWRRQNNNELVKSIYELVHNSNKDVVFGVSPSGIWANKTKNTPLGSDTKGSESYYRNFADSRRWIKEGYIDYIIPQIYWNIGYEKADYQKLVQWWVDVTKDTNVKLYIGQAAYKSGNANVNSPWYGVDEIKKQIELNRTTNLINGYAMYSYSIFNENRDLYNLIKDLNISK